MNNTVKITTSDDQEYDVLIDIVNMSVTLRNMLEDMREVMGSNPVPIPNVTSKIFSKVLEFCKYRLEHPVPQTDGEKEKGNTDLSEWEQAYCKVDQATLFELILAANYLDIKPLLDVTCKTVANMIKGKTPEEIRQAFNIKNDFTPEEEEQIRKENEWCEER